MNVRSNCTMVQTLRHMCGICCSRLPSLSIGCQRGSSGPQIVRNSGHHGAVLGVGYRRRRLALTLLEHFKERLLLERLLEGAAHMLQRARRLLEHVAEVLGGGASVRCHGDGRAAQCVLAILAQSDDQTFIAHRRCWQRWIIAI